MRVGDDSRREFADFKAQIVQARTGIGLGPSMLTQFGAWAAADCLYRGHARQEYALQPTLFRAAIAAGHPVALKKDKAPVRDKALVAIHDLEAQLFFEFAPRGKKLVPSIQGDWDILFLMRHHGVATRLLDWTQSFGTALYFALEPWVSRAIRDPDAADKLAALPWTQPELWLLNPYRLNTESREVEDIIAPRFLDEDDATYGDLLGDLSEPGMGWALPIAIFPETLNDRLHAQHGLFTIHGDRHDPMDALVGEKTVRRVPLPRGALPAALEFLADAGIMESTVFPDLDSLARDLHRKYGFPSR